MGTVLFWLQKERGGLDGRHTKKGSEEESTRTPNYAEPLTTVAQQRLFSFYRPGQEPTPNLTPRVPQSHPATKTSRT